MGAMGVLQGVSAVAGLYGSYTQAQAAKQQGKYEQSVYESNARMAELEAEEATSRGNREANRVRAKGRAVRGSQRAALAGQGVDVGTGTAADLQLETDTLSEMDALTVQNNAWREAWGYRAEASNLRYQGRFARLGAKTQARNTLLTGGVRFADDVVRGVDRYKRSK